MRWGIRTTASLMVSLLVERRSHATHPSPDLAHLETRRGNTVLGAAVDLGAQHATDRSCPPVGQPPQCRIARSDVFKQHHLAV